MFSGGPKRAVSEAPGLSLLVRPASAVRVKPFQEWALISSEDPDV